MTGITEHQTPVGRVLQGNPLDVQTKGKNGRPLINKQGEPKVNYFFALGIAKTDPGLPAIFADAQAVAQRDFPRGDFQLPTFAWKILDGDDPKYKDKIGFPGHYVFKCTSGFPITCFTKGGMQIITDKEHIKRGYYGRAIISFKGNKETDKPGLYINTRAFELFAYGEEIQVGPSGEELFGQGPTTVPTGASAIPVADATGGMPGATQVPGVSSAPGMLGATVPGVPEVMPDMTAPTGNFLNPQGPPPAADVPAATPPAPGNPPIKTMTPKAGGLPYEAYVKQGWTDAQLIAHGYMKTDDIPF